ncbi:hypothetical protein F2P81_001037 [Scophthalmus maximus]|uniref:Uncharacterized protein n=1 Tax=Scophthalmus maximus TaxID=52904 RepID=A0A6A4TW78_SCOMX|nr:hypothetical protein F2P81_001037 [Scophthalmus maximus]
MRYNKNVEKEKSIEQSLLRHPLGILPLRDRLCRLCHWPHLYYSFDIQQMLTQPSATQPQSIAAKYLMFRDAPSTHHSGQKYSMERQWYNTGNV